MPGREEELEREVIALRHRVAELERISTITLYFPRHQGEVPLRKSRSAAPKGCETILVVDDEPAVLDGVCAMLERLQYKVLRAGSAQEARQIAAGGARFDVLMTDVIMPGTNGVELAREIRARKRELRCLFMSAYDDEILSKVADRRELVSFLNKPFSMASLGKAIRALFAGVSG